jgi:hypothetical protein
LPLVGGTAAEATGATDAAAEAAAISVAAGTTGAAGSGKSTFLPRSPLANSMQSFTASGREVE